MDTPPPTTPLPSDEKIPSAPANGWLSRLKVSQKITTGYAIALGIAIVGAGTGVFIGNAYEQRALAIREDAVEEILALKDVEAALIHAIARERDLIHWLNDPEQFQQACRRYEKGVAEFQQQWKALLQSYEEDVEAGTEAESEGELEAIENLTERYSNFLDAYFQEFEGLLAQLDPATLQGDADALETAENDLLSYNRRPEVAKIQEFSDQLSDLVETIENDELVDSEETFEIALRLRNRTIVISLFLSVAIASLLTLPIIRAINRPLKALEEIALRVTREENFDLRATVSHKDEVGSLAVSLNQLIEWVEGYTRDLKLAKQQLETQTQELNTIIDNLGDGLLVVDSQGQIRRFNPALRQMFRLNNVALVGNPVQEVFDERITALIFRPETTPITDLDLADNRIGQALVTAVCLDPDSPQAEGGTVGAIVLIRDITAEKEIAQMKTDFISTVSHELRTPLTSVLGFAKLIQKKLEDTLLPAVNIENTKTERAARQVKENLRIIIAEGDRLTALINDVLDIAKIEAGKIEWNLQPLQIADIIEQAIASIAILARESGIEVIGDISPELPEIVGDRDRLLQVIVNLFSNALKFTNSGSVTCRAQRQQVEQQDEIVVSIIDTGIGLSPEDLDKVFEKFTQVGEVMTDKPKGTGLGLPICKQIVEHHGGRIWAESQLGQGSTFSFSLPLSRSLSPEFSSSSLKTLVQQLKVNLDRTIFPEENQQKTILVVDDEPPIRALLRQELEAEDYQVKEAKDGIEALKQINAAQPDLIVLDVMMPNIDGFDLAAVLKNNPETMGIPIIMLSIMQERERGYRLGVDRYLCKPIDTEVLLQDVKTLLAQGGSNRRVLAIDMDESTTKALTEVLLSKGYTLAETIAGKEGIERALALQPAMIIVDSSLSSDGDSVKTLRFEHDLDSIFFILMEQSTASSESTAI